MLFDTPDMSKTTTNLINNGYWLRTHASIDGVPADCRRIYLELLNKLTRHFKVSIDHIIKSRGGAIPVPMTRESIEKYLTGYTFEYRTFCNLREFRSGTEGYWRRDPNKQTHIIIYYNRCTLRARQQFSQIHELMHFLQTVDEPFLAFFDELILNTDLPESVIVKLLERATEKAVVMYLMPNDFFIKKYEEIEAEAKKFGKTEVRLLADAFGVSMQSALYRLQECVPQYKSNPLTFENMPP